MVLKDVLFKTMVSVDVIVKDNCTGEVLLNELPPAYIIGRYNKLLMKEVDSIDVADNVMVIRIKQ